jgi:glyceraldehyde 3-phosphate dehydrogenase
MPKLRGKVTGMAIRVPVPNVSLVDLNAELARKVEREEIEDAFDRAANGEMKGILGVERRPLVSSDFNHDPRSAVVDVPSLMVVDGTLVKVLAWYDNEWAYAVRTAEILLHVANLDKPASPAREVVT